MSAFRGIAGPKDAYDLLAEFGAGHDSSMTEIVRCGLAAQKARRLDDARKEAWSLLRDGEQRLMLDLLHWQDDPVVFGVPAAPDEPLPESTPPPLPGPDPDLIAQAIGALPVPEDVAPPAADLWRLVEQVWQAEPQEEA